MIIVITMYAHVYYYFTCVSVTSSYHFTSLHFTHPYTLETLDRIWNAGSVGLSKACWVFGDEKFHPMPLEFRACIDAHGTSHCSVSVKCNRPFINLDISQAAHKWWGHRSLVVLGCPWMGKRGNRKWGLWSGFSIRDESMQWYIWWIYLQCKVNPVLLSETWRAELSAQTWSLPLVW